MNDSMDIAVLLVNTSSMSLPPSTITNMILCIINPLIENNYDLRLALIKLRFGDGSQPSIVHSFTRSITNFEHWFVADHVPIGQHFQEGIIGICDALREALNLDWRTTGNDQCHENVVFLVTDGLPCRHLVNPTAIQNDDCSCACDDLWTISNEFVNRNLTLVIVGIGEIVSICDGLYGAVAKNTGGEYIPLTNASRILLLSFQSVITQGYTLSQSLRHIKQEEFEKDSSYHHSIIPKRNQFEIKHCHIMAQKGAWLLNHFHQVNFINNDENNLSQSFLIFDFD